MIYIHAVREIILGSLRQELLTRTSFHDIPEGVWKRMGALNTWGTNAVEGNTLNWKDVEKLILERRSVAGKPLGDVLETVQHEAAFRGLLSRMSKPISPVTVQDLHEEVFRGVLVDAGQWRRVNVRISGSKMSLPRMEKVVPLMEEWTKEYAERDADGEDVFRLGAWMHYSFEAVHPFSDGNGRVGRLLLNLHMLRHNWPPIHTLPPDRDGYLSSLEAADWGDLSPLVEFIRVRTGRSLLDLLDQLGTAQDELKPLKAFARSSGHSAQYLSLRAGQGALPAVLVRGDWHTSSRAIATYRSEVRRGSGKT